MGGQNGWRTNITFNDWMRDIEKRVLNEERRPIIRAASDLMGPGAGPYAVETSDWSSDETTFNGWFYSQPGALNSPDPTLYWIGTTEGIADGNGYELVRQYDPVTGLDVTADSYLRFFYTLPGTGQRQYTDWTLSSGSGGGGGGGAPTGPAGGDLSGTYPNPTISPATKTQMMLDVQDEGTAVVTDVERINFTGAGVTAAAGPTGTATVTIPGAGASGPAGGDLTGSYPNPTVKDGAINSAKIQDGSITSADLAPGTIPSNLPPSGAAGGSLAGTYPNPTLAAGSVGSSQIADGSIAAADLSPGALSATRPEVQLNGTQAVADAQAFNFIGAGVTSLTDSPTGTARIVVPGVVTQDEGVQVATNPTTNYKGAGVTAANNAGVTDVTVSGVPQGAAGGDLSGTYPNPTIGAGKVTSAAIADGTIQNADLADGAVNSAKIQDGTVTAADLAPGTLPTTLPPSGAAGGDLAGTYPNPTVAANAITSAKIADGTIVDGDVAAANKDGVAATPSMRTLGTGSQQAAAGNDPRIVGAASKTYVDAQDAALGARIDADPSKQAVRVATTAAITLSGLQTIDGLAVVDGDRVLVKNNASGNNIYIAHSGAWTVAPDCDATNEAQGAFVTALQGTVNNGTTWRVGNGSVTDMDALFWVRTTAIPSGAAGGGLTGTYPNPLIAAPVTTSQIATPAAPAAGKESIYFKADGFPYYMGSDGVEHPFLPPAVASHANPHFDLVAASTGGNNAQGAVASRLMPTSWDWFWGSVGLAQSSDPTITSSGTGYSLRTDFTVANSNQWYYSSIFPVAPNNLVTITLKVRNNGGGGQLSLGMASRAGGNPGPFDPDTIIQSQQVPLTNTWTQVSVSYTVPAGHTVCKVYLYEIVPTGAALDTIWVDDSGSTIQTVTVAQVPIGAISMYGGSAAPDGWLLCQGQSLDRTTYAILYGVIGTVYGAVDSTHFNLPDLRNRFPEGAGTDTPGTSGGTAAAQLPAHSHTNSHTHNLPLEYASTTATGGTAIRITDLNDSTGGTGTNVTATTTSASAAVGSSGSGTENRPPFLALNFIIRAT